MVHTTESVKRMQRALPLYTMHQDPKTGRVEGNIGVLHHLAKNPVESSKTQSRTIAPFARVFVI